MFEKPADTRQKKSNTKSMIWINGRYLNHFLCPTSILVSCNDFKNIIGWKNVVFTSFTSIEMKYSAGFTPAKLVSGLYQAFVFRVIFQVGHLVGLFVIETGILSIAWNDDVGPISTTL